MAKDQFRTLSDFEVTALLAACDETRYPIRNRAVVLLSCQAGLTPQEIAGLKRYHVGEASVGSHPCITLDAKQGKRLNNRIIPMPRGTALNGGIYRLLKNVPGIPSDPLILSERAMSGKAGPDEDQHMKRSSISYLFYKLYGIAGISGSAHTCRRTFIVRASRSIREHGGTLRDVQYLAGHKNLGGTQNYIELVENAHAETIGDLFSGIEIPDKAL